MNTVDITVNGDLQRATVEPRTSLADFLRDSLALTGTHIGCEHGICGACTVLINGEISRSCITYAVICDGANIQTIEGLDDDPLMEALRQAFSEEHALQCGYCTPGMLITARDVITRHEQLTLDTIRRHMSGNLCRCTGYRGIVNAIARVANDSATNRQESPITGLGPAPGPDKHHQTDPETSSSARVPPTHAAPETLSAPPLTNPVATATSTLDDWLTVQQTFSLPHPLSKVWALVSDPERVCDALPGIALDGPAVDGKVRGKAAIKLGPIAPTFAFTGTYEIEENSHKAIMTGDGSDRRTRSRVKGRAQTQLIDLGNEGTEVRFEIAYVMSGPLAQFGRLGLVQNLVARMTTRFAHNVEKALDSRNDANAPTP
ncbi:MAG TPA: 2Fe-2S iron-sulfur cluster binding domain-containing protein, partial [Gammaproteobacteria bacterium]|nr:2Fe-2S iron-sulfur cluster binding domain-containing protein [Gammaproteobacteria bacterium]